MFFIHFSDLWWAMPTLQILQKIRNSQYEKNTYQTVIPECCCRGSLKECFLGKTAAVTAASPGGLGGIRALPHIRTLLSNLKVHVIPEQLSVANASKAFQEDGTLVSDSQAKALESVCRQLVDVTRALKK